MTVQSESAVGSVSVPSLPAKPSMLARITDKLISPFFAILLVAYWEFHVRYFEVDALLLPPPSKILVSLWHGLASGLFLEHLGITIYRALSGFLIAMFMGIALGALISQFKFIEKTVYPWVVALQTVPKIAIAPPILVWCAYGSLSKIVTATLVAFFPILVNTIIGLRSCEQGKLDLMRSLKAGRWLTFRMVQLPNALPFIFAGLSVAVVFSILGALVGEFVGSKDGIGFLILDANYQLNIPRVFALLIMLAAYGITCHVLLRYAHRKLVFWNDQHNVTSAGVTPDCSDGETDYAQSKTFSLNAYCRGHCRVCGCLPRLRAEAYIFPHDHGHHRGSCGALLLAQVHEVLGEGGYRRRRGGHSGRHGRHAADRRKERHLRQPRPGSADDGARERRQGQVGLYLLQKHHLSRGGAEELRHHEN